MNAETCRCLVPRNWQNSNVCAYCNGNINREAPTPDRTCPVPECVNGWVRVPVIETQVHYGNESRYVRFEDVQCAMCWGGMKR
jgi:hypothetical protein